MTENKKPFSRYFYNPLTYLGVLISITIFVIEAFLFIFDFFSHSGHVYLGIITYCILPIFLVFGLILIPIGALWHRARIIKGKESGEIRRFTIDPSKAEHRNAIFVFFIGTFILIVMTGIGSYKAFHYTESVHFCGITCHKVMEPEYTTYTQSSHARVKCVECHIGEGAGWYVRSKMSGARQVVKTLTDTYEKPIQTPVHNLRPAEETCGACHWPDKFYSSVEMRKTYYSSDSDTPRKWLTRMLVHVGRDQNEDQGIHAHMYADNQVYYAAEDDRKQDITWVKSVHTDGTSTIFTSPGSKYENEPPPEEVIHKMDCIDCHNRPTHKFRAPYQLVNQAMARGQVDELIPGIKGEMMSLLSREYKSTEEAVKLIEQDLINYYKTKHPDYYVTNSAAIQQAAQAAIKMYQSNFFPEMETRWDTHNENIGHLWSQGCFRCHGGEHSSSDGRVITRDCTTCHTIIEQGPSDMTEKNPDGIPFVHPFENNDLWQDINCSNCHTGN